MLAAAAAGRRTTNYGVRRIVSCVPEVGGFRGSQKMISDDANTIAETLQIHPGSARARIATKRLLMIARVVLEQEAAA
ncbi:hypothetical protein ACRAWC_25765 [Leifsonia sp. L25]|uniref:hypothetical protein n=1 Tax=Leifsonia sp. L25 TaxID=3423957 RepID=UPI003D68AE02